MGIFAGFAESLEERQSVKVPGWAVVSRQECHLSGKFGFHCGAGAFFFEDELPYSFSIHMAASMFLNAGICA